MFPFPLIYSCISSSTSFHSLSPLILILFFPLYLPFLPSTLILSYIPLFLLIYLLPFIPPSFLPSCLPSSSCHTSPSLLLPSTSLSRSNTKFHHKLYILGMSSPTWQNLFLKGLKRFLDDLATFSSLDNSHLALAGPGWHWSWF